MAFVLIIALVVAVIALLYVSIQQDATIEQYQRSLKVKKGRKK